MLLGNIFSQQNLPPVVLTLTGGWNSAYGESKLLKVRDRYCILGTVLYWDELYEVCLSQRYFVGTPST